MAKHAKPCTTKPTSTKLAIASTVSQMKYLPAQLKITCSLIHKRRDSSTRNSNQPPHPVLFPPKCTIPVQRFEVQTPQRERDDQRDVCWDTTCMYLYIQHQKHTLNRETANKPVISRPASHLAVRVGEECMARERRNDEVDEREEGEGSEENGEVGREGSEPWVKGVGGACPRGCKTWALGKVTVITYESRVTGCRSASLMYESCRV